MVMGVDQLLALLIETHQGQTQQRWLRRIKLQALAARQQLQLGGLIGTPAPTSVTWPTGETTGAVGPSPAGWSAAAAPGALFWKLIVDLVVWWEQARCLNAMPGPTLT